jgi:hypothetical protein
MSLQDALTTALCDRPDIKLLRRQTGDSSMAPVAGSRRLRRCARHSRVVSDARWFGGAAHFQGDVSSACTRRRPMKTTKDAIHRRRGRWHLPGSAGMAADMCAQWRAQSPKAVG